MALTLRRRGAVPLIENEVERRPAILDLRLGDLARIHRTDQICARKYQPAFAVCAQQPALEAVEREVVDLAITLDGAPDRGDIDLLSVPAVGADARNRVAHHVEEVLRGLCSRRGRSQGQCALRLGPRRLRVYGTGRRG